MFLDKVDIVPQHTVQFLKDRKELLYIISIVSATAWKPRGRRTISLLPVSVSSRVVTLRSPDWPQTYRTLVLSSASLRMGRRACIPVRDSSPFLLHIWWL